MNHQHISTTRQQPVHTLLISLCVLALLIPAASTAQLSDSQRAEKTRQLKQMREQMLQLRDSISQKQQTHDQLSSKLATVEKQLSQRNQDISRIKSDIQKQNRTLVAIERDKTLVNQQLLDQRVLLAKQIRSSYMTGKQEYLKLLLNLDDAASLGRVMTYYDYFNRARAQQISRVNLALQKLDEVNRTAITERQRLQDLQQQHEQALLAQQQDRQQRQQLLASISRELQDENHHLRRLAENEKQLQNLLNRIRAIMPAILTEADSKQPFARRQGKLKWPVKGKLVKRFGQARGGSGAQWQGVIINHNPGDGVRAVSHGRVAFADWLRGYGMLLIIDHGDGYMSLYGHNESLRKEVGDWVEEGDEIGLVGQGGGTGETGAYFELRHKGVPLNPGKWCRS